MGRYGEVVGSFYCFFRAVVPPCAAAVPCGCSRGWKCFSRAVPGICGVAVAAGWRCADADGNKWVPKFASFAKVLSKQEKLTL